MLMVSEAVDDCESDAADHPEGYDGSEISDDDLLLTGELTAYVLNCSTEQSREEPWICVCLFHKLMSKKEH